MSKKLTAEEVNARLADRGLKLVGEYKGAKVPSEFQCSYGHSWTATPSNVIAGDKSGCPICANYRIMAFI